VVVVVAVLLWCALVGFELAGAPPAVRFAVALLVGASLAALPRAGGVRAVVAALALLVAVQWYGVPVVDRPALFVRQGVAAAAGLLIAGLVAVGARFRRPVVWTVVLGLGVLAPGLYVLDPAPAWAFGYRLAHRAEFARAASDLSAQGIDDPGDRFRTGGDRPRHLVETGWGYGFLYVGDIPEVRLMMEMEGGALTVTADWIWVEPRWRDDGTSSAGIASCSTRPSSLH
jgi:hypothetical protein